MALSSQVKELLDEKKELADKKKADELEASIKKQAELLVEARLKKLGMAVEQTSDLYFDDSDRPSRKRKGVMSDLSHTEPRRKVRKSPEENADIQELKFQRFLAQEAVKSAESKSRDSWKQTPSRTKKRKVRPSVDVELEVSSDEDGEVSYPSLPLKKKKKMKLPDLPLDLQELLDPEDTSVVSITKIKSYLVDRFPPKMKGRIDTVRDFAKNYTVVGNADIKSTIDMLAQTFNLLFNSSV
jgi:hypothetical protein